MHIIPMSFVCGLAVALLAVAVFTPPKVPEPARPASDFNRFFHHLVYWLVALFLVKLLVPHIPKIISPLVVCWISSGCTMLTYLLVRPRRPEVPLGSLRATRFATAFFWWFAAGFLVSLILLIAMSDGRG
jgi:hypothetical protein